MKRTASQTRMYQKGESGQRETRHPLSEVDFRKVLAERRTQSCRLGIRRSQSHDGDAIAVRQRHGVRLIDDDVCPPRRPGTVPPARAWIDGRAADGGRRKHVLLRRRPATTTAGAGSRQGRGPCRDRLDGERRIPSATLRRRPAGPFSWPVQPVDVLFFLRGCGNARQHSHFTSNSGQGQGGMKDDAVAAAHR